MTLAERLRSIADQLEAGDVRAAWEEVGGVQMKLDADSPYVRREDAGLRVVCIVWSEGQLPEDSAERAAAGVVAALGDQSLRTIPEA